MVPRAVASRDSQYRRNASDETGRGCVPPIRSLRDLAMDVRIVERRVHSLEARCHVRNDNQVSITSRHQDGAWCSTGVPTRTREKDCQEAVMNP